MIFLVPLNASHSYDVNQVDRWVDLFRAIKGHEHIPVTVLTENHCDWKHPLKMIDASPYADLVRPDNLSDRRAVLILSALQYVGPALFLDPHYIPTSMELLSASLFTERMAMLRPDTQATMVRAFGNTETVYPIYSSNVMSFLNDHPGPGLREAMAIDYRESWHWIAQHANYADTSYRSERAWAMVNHGLGSAVIPDSLFTIDQSDL